MSALEGWSCYVCGSTKVHKYNAVQDDGRYVCENDHLLHEDALRLLAEQQQRIGELESITDLLAGALSVAQNGPIGPNVSRESFNKHKAQLIDNAKSLARYQPAEEKP